MNDIVRPITDIRVILRQDYALHLLQSVVDPSLVLFPVIALLTVLSCRRYLHIICSFTGVISVYLAHHDQGWVVGLHG